MSADDPIWGIIGTFNAGEPNNIFERVDEYLMGPELAQNHDA